MEFHASVLHLLLGTPHSAGVYLRGGTSVKPLTLLCLRVLCKPRFVIKYQRYIALFLVEGYVNKSSGAAHLSPFIFVVLLSGL